MGEDSTRAILAIAPMPRPQRHVLVCTNARPPGNPKGSCAEKGSEGLFDDLKAMVKERGLGSRVIVNRTSCLKHCSRGITVAVYPENVWYAGVTRADLEEICASHLEKGEPLVRLFMPDIPWE
jgi:(2Fe-2S) ferredoxin